MQFFTLRPLISLRHIPNTFALDKASALLPYCNLAMALSVTRSGWDLGFKPLLDGAARTSSKHLKDRKEASSSSKKKDSKRSSQQKSKAKAKKAEEQGPTHPTKSPFSCDCADRAWNFDKTGHPFCLTCSQKSTSLRAVDPKTSDSTISTVAESKEDDPGTSNESLRACSSQGPSPGTAQSVSRLKNQNTIQAILRGTALEQQYSGSSSSDTSTRLSARRKDISFTPAIVLTTQPDSNRSSQDRSVSFGSRLGQRLSQSIKDACHHGVPAEKALNPGFEISSPEDEHIRLTATFEEPTNTHFPPKPIMKSRSKTGSAHTITPPRRVSFEDSSTSEAIMTPATGSSAIFSGNESDFESSSSDGSAGYDSDRESRGSCRGSNLVNEDIAPWAARKLALNSLNPYKAVLEAKYSKPRLTGGEFGSRHPCFHQECSIRTHVNGAGSAKGGALTYRHSQSAESRSLNTQKRKAAVRDPSRDDDDDEEERNGQRRGPKTPRDSSPPAERRLACPFFQRHPGKAPKAGSCVQSGFKGVSNLKEHLYRIHENDLLCPRCYQKVDERDFTDHVRACRIVRPDEEHPILDGFDRIQKMKISDKMRGKTTEEKWRAIYKILFPDDPDDTIPSPYWTDQVVLRKEEAMRSLDSYETFIRRELPLRLHRRVHGSAATNFNSVFSNEIIDVATDALNETISAYWRGEGASLPGRTDERNTHLRATPGPSRTAPSIVQATNLDDLAAQSPPDSSSNPFISAPSLQGYDGTIHQHMFGSSMRFPQSSQATSASSTRQHYQHTHFPSQQTSTIPVISSQPCSNSSGFVYPAFNANSFHTPAHRQSREPTSTPEDLQWCFSNESYRS